jgi:Zn-dependent peptidase ImmA (M78 family)/transcriptional regulator with XRE-family HTH domain
MTDHDRQPAAAATADEDPPDAEGIEVEPSVLMWARQSLGLDEERAAKKIGVVVGTLQKWESGDKAPTLPQLRKVAAAYKRPLAVLLLPAPAKDFDALRDFRRGLLREAGIQSPELTAEYRRALTQREVVLEIGDLGGRTEETPELPALSLDASDEDAGTTIRSWLDVPTRWQKPAQAFGAWIDAAEARGILVVQTKAVPPKEMSGFSVSEFPHPVVALNGSDVPKRRLFTLAHEMAHLALNAGGLCDLHEDPEVKALEDRIELFCNRAAAAALMPLDSLVHIREFGLAKGDKQWTPEQLDTLAAPFGTSAESMLLRLVGLGKASWDWYWHLKPQFEEAYAAARAKQKESERGPTFYQVKARDLGPGYIRTVLDAFRGRTISSLDAADYLDVKFEQIPKLEQAAR